MIILSALQKQATEDGFDANRKRYRRGYPSGGHLWPLRLRKGGLTPHARRFRLVQVGPSFKFS